MKRFVAFIVAAAATAAVAGAGIQDKKAPAAPNVVGKWSGVWGPYAPPQLDPGKDNRAVTGGSAVVDRYSVSCKAMDCTVEEKPDGTYQATFEGECGRPYKYTIKMSGRAVGDTVLFSGSADLGEMDGGVYDWIGRANGKEFVGFFTSRGYTGTFRMAKPLKK
jgi:hypothetical protein